MTSVCPLAIKPSRGIVELSLSDLSVGLGEREARLILDWFSQAAGLSVTFLLRVDCGSLEIEGRNYDRHIELLVFGNHGSELKARTFCLPKVSLPAFIDELERSISKAFR